MNRRILTLVGVVFIAIMIALALWVFIGSVTPYTRDFSEAKTGKQFQVFGYIDHTSLSVNHNIHYFKLKDEKGDYLPIMLITVLPSNFGQANSCVVIGHWTDEVFLAESILLKCPSKYEEEEQ